MFHLGLCFLFILFTFTRESSAACNYQQVMDPNVNYYVYNPNYAQYYQGENHCSWRAIVTQYSQIVVSCIVTIPSTDRILVRVPGENDWLINTSGSHFRVFSTYELTIFFDSVSNTAGGQFYCQLTAIPGGTPPATPAPCDCGWKQANRIVGGEETGPNEFPFMAGIVETIRYNPTLVQSRIVCGATIISERHVMTAAHCITSFNTSTLLVLVGEHDPTTGFDTSAAAVHLIESVLVHERFNATSYENDIALITTTTAIGFSSSVGPVCLPYTLWVADGSYNVTVMGWGVLEFGGRTSDTLQKVDLSTLSQSQCSSRRKEVRPTQICTWTEGKDACQFDSGGPAVWFDPTRQRYKCVGIVSYGTGCADQYPGVYTRVASYIPWLEQKTGVNFCRK